MTPACSKMHMRHELTETRVSTYTPTRGFDPFLNKRGLNLFVLGVVLNGVTALEACRNRPAAGNDGLQRLSRLMKYATGRVNRRLHLLRFYLLEFDDIAAAHPRLPAAA